MVSPDHYKSHTSLPLQYTTNVPRLQGQTHGLSCQPRHEEQLQAPRPVINVYCCSVLIMASWPSDNSLLEVCDGAAPHLHVPDVLPAPERLKDQVCEAEHLPTQP